MADIYAKVEAYNASGSSDAGASLGANTRKTTEATFNYGTPNIYPLVITRTDESDWTGYADSNSDFHKVMTVIQSRAEIYGIGEVSGTQFTILVKWNTLAQDDTASENTGYPQVVSGDLDYLETEVNDATGITVTIYHGKIEADDISYNEC
jgi:hypothetical protein